SRQSGQAGPGRGAKDRIRAEGEPSRRRRRRASGGTRRSASRSRESGAGGRIGRFRGGGRRALSGKKMAVLVAGSWGTALANVLADNGHEVRLWTRSAEQAEAINSRHRNERFLGDAPLNPAVRATVSIREALEGAAMALVAAPTSAVRDVAAKMRPHLDAGTLVIHAAKGFEEETLKPDRKS